MVRTQDPPGFFVQEYTIMASDPIQRRKLYQEVQDRLLARIRSG